MCRLFGLTAGRERVRATFWLLDAPDSLDRQSHANPDGTGLGWWDPTGRPIVEKQPAPAFDDADFVTEAKDRESTTYVAHVRHATGTPVSEANTHPFVVDRWIGAHNGAIGDLPALEAHLGDGMAMVHGDTDSERILALVAQEARRLGDVGAGMAEALSWLGQHVPVLAVNLMVSSRDELWACRYPETHELWLLDRTGDEPLQHRSDAGTRVESAELGNKPCVVIASERLDDDPRWRLLDPGTLVHVDADLGIHETRIEPAPLRRMS